MISPQDLQQHERQAESLNLHAPSMLPGYLEAVAYLVKARAEGSKARMIRLIDGKAAEDSPSAA